MLEILVLQHHVAESPGAISNWAHRNGHRITCLLVPEEKLLPNADLFDAVIVLGGPWCTFSDNAPGWLQMEKHWIKHCIDAKKPIFAICMGAQLLASALGGDVARMSQPETGWHTVSNVSTNENISVLQWHEDTFSIPSSTELLLTGNQNIPQGFKSPYGTLVGLQFHAEWTQKIVDDLHQAFGDDCPLPKNLSLDELTTMHSWLFQQLTFWEDSIVKTTSSLAAKDQQ
jgi:GMP synthase-like glutamine amidotransferase